MDIHQIGYTLNNFLNRYKDIILEEHYEELKQHLDFLKQFKDSTLVCNSYKQYHWDICPYTSDLNDSLPDTCPCASADLIMNRVTKLINLYRRII